MNEFNITSAMLIEPHTNKPDLKLDLELIQTPKASYVYTTHLTEVLLKLNPLCTSADNQESFKL